MAGTQEPILLRRWSEPLRRNEREGEQRRSLVEGEGGRVGEGEGLLWFREREPTEEREAFLLIFFCFLLQRGISSLTKFGKTFGIPCNLC
jgi:hypothetical protein